MYSLLRLLVTSWPYRESQAFRGDIGARQEMMQNIEYHIAWMRGQILSPWEDKERACISVYIMGLGTGCEGENDGLAALALDCLSRGSTSSPQLLR